MKCAVVHQRLSPFVDGELDGHERRVVAEHLGGCAACAERERELRTALEDLSALPRLAAPAEVAARVMSRVEAENRGPGLRSLYRSFWSSRPLLVPSLFPATLVLALTLGTIVSLNGPVDLPSPVSVTVGEWNTAPQTEPFMAVSMVGLPRRHHGALDTREVLDNMVEGSLFVESLVAKDGTVWAVTVLDGNQELANPIRDALWSERFEPTHYRGRPVAVSVLRLISRMEVRAPVT